MFLISTLLSEVFYFKYSATNLRKVTRCLEFLAFFTKPPGNANWVFASRVLVLAALIGFVVPVSMRACFSWPVVLFQHFRLYRNGQALCLLSCEAIDKMLRD